MKAKLALQQYADVSALTETLQGKLQWITEGGNRVAVFPAGTEFEGTQAIRLCRTGQASPSDDECANAVGMTETQLESLQLGYKMDTLGINSKEDRELYRAGVILGYSKDKEYIPGPNWDAYHEAKTESDVEEI